MALGDIGSLMQKADAGSTTLIDVCNGFNNMIRLAMLWTVGNFWPAGMKFVFKCYKHWA